MAASQITLSTSGTPYLIINDMLGQFYNVDTSAFEDFASLNWEDYALSGTQVGSSQIHHFEFPAGIATGTYDVIGLLQGGATALESDSGIANGTFYWDGTAAVLLPQEPCGAELVYDSIYVSHDYPTTDNLQVLDDDGEVEADVIIRAFTSDNWQAGNRSANYVALEDTTGYDGRWLRGGFLPPDTYMFTFTKIGHYLKTREIEVS